MRGGKYPIMGAFAIYNDCNTDSTIISNLFIDEYMKDAGEADLKVYLYLVRMMSAGRSTSIGEMSELFGHSEKEIARALVHWEQQGLLVLNKDARNHLVSIHLCPVCAPMTAAASKESDSESSRVISIQPILEGKKTASATAPVSNAVSVQAPLYSDEDKAQILFVVEQYIGKPLSPSEMQVIYYIADELHFSNDLIDYLVQYCVERGKKDFRYIEKVAINWKESGIQTSQDAKKAAVSSSRARRARKPAASTSSNGFTRIEQHEYDFEALEKALLQN